MSNNLNVAFNFSGSDASILAANVLPDVLGITKARLQEAASGDIFAQVFGDKANTAALQTIKSQWSVGDFSQLPEIQILSAASLNAAAGAYAASTQTVYLSDSLLNSAAPANSLTGAVGVLVEETFHWLDSLVGTDTSGDEGELARTLLYNPSVSSADLSRIKSENDSGFATVNGQSIAVEQFLFTDPATNIVFANGNPIKYLGKEVTTSTFGDWQAVAAEFVGGQNQVLWKNATTSQSLTWNVDANWNWLSNNAIVSLNSGDALGQERNFGVDLNSDGFVGPVNLEWQGSTSLVKGVGDALFVQQFSIANNLTPVAIQYKGAQVTANQFAGWQAVAAETIGGQNQVLWENTTTSQSVVWNLDANWNWVSNSAITALNSGAAVTQESNFRLDLNNDGYIGDNLTTLESAGTTKLVKNGSGAYSAQVDISTPVAIKFNGVQTSTSSFAGWQAVAAEGTQVLWKNSGTNQALTWNVDANWNYVSASAISDLNSDAVIGKGEVTGLESTFGVDLNGDGFVRSSGLTSYSLESQGNAALFKGTDNKYSVQLNSEKEKSILDFGGSQVSTSSFAGWEALAADTVTIAGAVAQSQVLWRNVAANQAVVWNTDSKWKYTSSGAVFALNSTTAIAQEATFGVDLNGDGFVGAKTDANAVSSVTYSVIERNGNVFFGKDTNNFLYSLVGRTTGGVTTNTTPVAIKYQGAQLSANQFAGWEAVAADVIAVKDANGVFKDQNQILWKNAATGQALIWTLDANWNYVSAGSVFSVKTIDAALAEVNFTVDLSGNSVIGPKGLEFSGATRLISDDNNAYYTQVGAATPVAITYNGVAVSPTSFAGWQAVGAETIKGENQVLWKNTATGSAVVWTVDDKWAWKSNGTVFALNSTTASAQEKAFGVDLNGDTLSNTFETNDNQILIRNNFGELYVSLAGGPGVALRNSDGNQLTTNAFTLGNINNLNVLAVEGSNVLVKNAVNAYEVATTATNLGWTLTDSPKAVALNNLTAIAALESKYKYDINGDGSIGGIDGGKQQLKAAASGLTVVDNTGATPITYALADTNGTQLLSSTTSFAGLAGASVLAVEGGKVLVKDATKVYELTPTITATGWKLPAAGTGISIDTKVAADLNTIYGYETTYGLNVDVDGLIGAQIDAKGTQTLFANFADGTNDLYVGGAAAPAALVDWNNVAVKFGNRIKADGSIAGDRVILAVEGNKVLLKDNANAYEVAITFTAAADNKAAFFKIAQAESSKLAITPANAADISKLETTYGVDLNVDGIIGTAIESNGNSKLFKDPVSNALFVQANADTTALKDSTDAPILSTTTAIAGLTGASIKAVESRFVNGNRVTYALVTDATNAYEIAITNGRLAATAGTGTALNNAVAADQAKIRNFEINYGVDLNGDGIVFADVLDGAGSSQLLNGRLIATGTDGLAVWGGKLDAPATALQDKNAAQLFVNRLIAVADNTLAKVGALATNTATALARVVAVEGGNVLLSDGLNAYVLAVTDGKLVTPAAALAPVALGTADAAALETTYGFDLNGDGLIGGTVINPGGDVKLVTDDKKKLYAWNGVAGTKAVAVVLGDVANTQVTTTTSIFGWTVSGADKNGNFLLTTGTGATATAIEITSTQATLTSPIVLAPIPNAIATVAGTIFTSNGAFTTAITPTALATPALITDTAAAGFASIYALEVKYGVDLNGDKKVGTPTFVAINNFNGIPTAANGGTTALNGTFTPDYTGKVTVTVIKGTAVDVALGTVKFDATDATAVATVANTQITKVNWTFVKGATIPAGTDYRLKFTNVDSGVYTLGAAFTVAA